MPRERVIKCGQHFDLLLAQGRKVTADATEHRHPVFGTETPGDLLLDFDHPQISLRLVIVKRHSKIVQEPQHGPLPLRESIQQITSRALFGSPSCWLLGRWGRGIGKVAFGEDLIIATKE